MYQSARITFGNGWEDVFEGEKISFFYGQVSGKPRYVTGFAADLHGDNPITLKVDTGVEVEKIEAFRTKDILNLEHEVDPDTGPGSEIKHASPFHTNHF